MSERREQEHSSTKRDAFYVALMQECVTAIESCCAAGDPASEERTLDAVLRRIQILTESPKGLSDELKVVHPSVPWRELAGFRNLVSSTMISGFASNASSRFSARTCPC